MKNKIKEKIIVYMKKCCKLSKNWRDFAVISWDTKSGSLVNYKCIKCGKTYGMDYGKYLKRLRKDNPNKRIMA